MAAKIIDGRKIAEEIKAEVKQKTLQLKSDKGIVPGLAFILVGDNPASESYVKSKNKACDEAGFFSITEKLPSSTSEKEILKLLDQFNHDKKIHGILVQLPLPEHIGEQKIIEAIDYRKDVDGFHPINLGKLIIGHECFRPCTPAGIQELLIRCRIETSGKHVVVAGRSNIVGKPIANILLQKQKSANAIVTIVHTGTKDISHYTKQGDILISAIGRPKFITADMVKPGAVVIDVGINRIPDATAKNGSRIVGDVDFDSVINVASMISPVPGGVGLMTIAMLLQNTLKAATQLTDSR
jgi:methylenetetrahydrofolate dehydrogenase (NADP+) / methenyltetrahydrofolate cyclohydrolase